MNKESIILVTKDAFCIDYLPAYGNTYWKNKTPNIDELVKKGIVYKNFYTAAPSSAMSYLCMFTGKYSYQQKIDTFKPLERYTEETLFDRANKDGFKTHVVWDEGWMKGAYRYSMCYGINTEIHAIKGLRQPVGAQYIHSDALKNDDDKAQKSISLIDECLNDINKNNEKVFVWMHIPHVINGRTCYGGDIDLFDSIIGVVRKYFSDEGIFISADHGNMNGRKGKLGYGFDVYQPAIRIPLITHKLRNSVSDEQLMSNIDFYQIIFNKEIPKREYILSDTAYYAQEDRDLAIIIDNYKYIYHKKEKKEELFDLEYDPFEEFNLISDKVFDVDRKVFVPSNEEYFYHNWDKLENYRREFRKIKDCIWKNANLYQKFIELLKKVTRPIRFKIKRKKTK